MRPMIGYFDANTMWHLISHRPKNHFHHNGRWLVGLNIQTYIDRK